MPGWADPSLDMWGRIRAMDAATQHPDPPGPAPDDPSPAAGPAPMDERHRLAFTVLNASTAPVWLAMIVAPRSRFTAWLVRVATPLSATLGVAYVGLLGAAAVQGARDGEGFPRFDDPDALRRGLSSPTAFLAGWTHYLVFDLYVGRHIWAEARSRGRVDRLPLLLTWWAGPAGLTLHLARNLRGSQDDAADAVEV